LFLPLAVLYFVGAHDLFSHNVKQRHPLQRTAGQAQTRGAGFLAQASD
jgi:hypothetical protein